MGVVGISRKYNFSSNTGSTKVEVDIVADDGQTWIEAKKVKPFGLKSSAWLGTVDDQGLKRQAEELLEAARQNPNAGQPPKVVIDFPYGVSQEVANELKKMGVEVRVNNKPVS